MVKKQNDIIGKRVNLGTVMSINQLIPSLSPRSDNLFFNQFYQPNVNTYAWLLTSSGHQTCFFLSAVSDYPTHAAPKKRFCFNKQFAVWHTMLRKATLSPAVNSAVIAKLDKKMIESVCYTFVGLPLQLLMEMLLFIQQCNNTFCNLWMHIPQITKGNIVD